MPIINRGTWSRVYTYRQTLTKFLRAYESFPRVNIISLGAGYDTNYFWIQDSIVNEELPVSLSGKVTMIEIDFHEVVSKKI